MAFEANCLPESGYHVFMSFGAECLSRATESCRLLAGLSPQVSSAHCFWQKADSSPKEGHGILEVISMTLASKSDNGQVLRERYKDYNGFRDPSISSLR